MIFSCLVTVSGPTLAFCDRNDENYDLFVTVTTTKITTKLRRAVTCDLVVIHKRTVPGIKMKNSDKRRFHALPYPRELMRSNHSNFWTVANTQKSSR